MKLPPITPGPWSAVPQRTSVSVKAIDGPTIATIRSSYDPADDADRKGADARAIAQVPAMLAMLSTVRTAIATLEEDDLGFSDPNSRHPYPLRDELLHNLDAILLAAGCELEAAKPCEHPTELIFRVRAPGEVYECGGCGLRKDVAKGEHYEEKTR